MGTDIEKQVITTSDLVVRRLEQHGIRNAFGVAGGAIMYITDSLRRCSNIECIITHHEQGAAIAAEAYSKLTNRPAILFATAGPGVTNAITGIADAFMDSIPMIALFGDVRSAIAADFSKQRYNAPQEVNQYALMKSIVKSYTLLTPKMNANEIISAIDASVHTCTSGRPGPICIVLPLDVQGNAVNASALLTPIPRASRVQCASSDLLREAFQSILIAERPLVLLGSGVRLSGMQNQIEKLIAQFKLPWCVTIGAVDLQDPINPLSCGCVGPTSQRAANIIFHAADCILALATSFDQSITGFNTEDLIHNKKVYLINIDSGEGLRFNDPRIRPIEASVFDFIEANKKVTYTAPRRDSWLKQILQIKSLLTADIESKIRTTVGVGWLSAYDITEEISRKLSHRSTVILGISLDAHTVFNAFIVKRGQRVIVSRNLGPMGWDIPAALGAAFAAQDPHSLVLITGDGSLMLNIQELAVIAGRKIPVCIFVFSNDGYASIRTTQSNFFGTNYLGCNAASKLYLPALEPLALGFGLQYNKLESLAEIGPLLANHVKIGSPRLVACPIDPGQMREPRLVSKAIDGKFITPPIYDMTPPLAPEISKKIDRVIREGKNLN